MFRFTLTPDVVRVEGNSRDTEWLSDYMSLYPKNVFFTLKYAHVNCKLCKRKMVYEGRLGWRCNNCNVYQKGWDGSECFYNRRTKTFSIGFWLHIKRALKIHHKKYKIVSDSRTPLAPIEHLALKTETLYDDQITALNSWLTKGGRGIVWCAPGFGKTELAMGAIKILFDRKLIKSALFVCSGLDAMTQTRERMDTQLKVRGTILVTNIQALARALKVKDPETVRFLKSLDFLIIDECHHQRAAEFKKLVNLHKGKYRLGISASPFHEYKKADLHSMRSDDAAVLKLLGPVVSRFSASSLIEKGRLAKPIVFFCPLPEVDMPFNPTWPLTKKLMLTNNEAMHKVIARFVATAAQAGEQSLVVAGGIKKLAFNVWRALDKRGVTAKFLHGGIDKDYRNWTRKELIKGGIDAICATTIYDEAVDLPNLRLLALAYGGLSDIKLEQRTGRDLRKKKGSNTAIILDFLCTSNKHLKKHSYARIKHYMAERAFEFRIVGHHSSYVNRIFRDRAEFINELPGVEFFKDLKRGIDGNDS